MTTHVYPCGDATTRVVSANTWHVTCFGFLGDLFPSFFILGIVLRNRPYIDFEDLDAIWRVGLSAQGCAIWGPVVATPNLGDEIPPKPNPYFWSVNRLFKPIEQNIETCILWKLLHRFQPNFAQHLRPPSAHRGWSKYTPNKFKMADGRHFLKPFNCHIYSGVRSILMKFGTVGHIDRLQLIDR